MLVGGGVEDDLGTVGLEGEVEAVDKADVADDRNEV